MSSVLKKNHVIIIDRKGKDVSCFKQKSNEDEKGKERGPVASEREEKMKRQLLIKKTEKKKFLRDEGKKWGKEI